MKNTFRLSIILCMAIFLAFNSSNAQDSNPIRLGIKAGVNFTNLYTKNANNTKMLTGFNAGIFAKLPVSNFVAFQPELYYTAKGAEITYDNSFATGSASFHLNYLELPLLIVGNISKYFNIHAGPYAAFLLSGKVKNESNVALFDFEKNLDTKDYNSFDAGFAIGAGLDLKAVSFGLRYNYGLTNVGKERSFAGTTYTYPDAHNGVINFYVSLALN